MNDKTLDQYLRKLSLREKELKEAKKENCSIEKLKMREKKLLSTWILAALKRGRCIQIS